MLYKNKNKVLIEKHSRSESNYNKAWEPISNKRCWNNIKMKGKLKYKQIRQKNKNNYNNKFIVKR